MTTTSFNDDWRVGPNVSVFAEITGGATSETAVTLPHDAMLALLRASDAPSGSSSGYFHGGAVTYRKDFIAPDAWADRVIEIEFEGVYRDAMVYLNGVLIGQRPNGYSPFRVRLDQALRYGQTNRLRVDARAHRDSRWYSGLGIYRDVWLHELPVTHIVPGSVRVSTPDVELSQAVVEVAVDVRNDARFAETRGVRAVVADAAGGVVATGESMITVRPNSEASARIRLYVDNPHRWNVDDPYLYSVQVELSDGGDAVDSEAVPLGIRTLQLDPRQGLRVNGEPTKLRGACIHHDNGVLGAVSLRDAELRRVRILKEAGFNAIRSSHNTIGRAFLDACDQLGLFVIDEAFDMWTEGKQPFDYSLSFPEWWRRDIEAMVRKDVNHPSVIMYSIGNEILDAGKPLGAAIGRDLAEEVRRLDPTRYLTNGISGFVATLSDTVPAIQKELEGVPGGINDAQGVGAALIDRVGKSEFVTEATAESHSIVDVAGHNYAEWRYEAERERFPNRIVLGTETNPKDIAQNWELVQTMPWVIGDFTWTGWDYLGEAGLGVVSYPEDGERWNADQYPALLAFCGDIDITGRRRPASFYREIVFGLRSEPFIAVHAPVPAGRQPAALGWAWSDSASEWTWDVADGAEMTVDVYSDADEVELSLNGSVIAQSTVGAEQKYVARFIVPYESGSLTARNLRHGVPSEQATLTTAGPAARLHAYIDDSSDTHAHVSVAIVDADGNVVPTEDREVTVRPGSGLRLLGFGSANPATPGSYNGDTFTTYLGRAFAVLERRGEGGEILIEAAGLDSARIKI